MTIISSIAQSTTQATKANSSSDVDSQSKSTAPSNEQETRRQAFSNRAQKIQKLNEEFFQGGPRSVKITPDFIQRLQEYGFLNKTEANSFISQLDDKQTESTGTLGELSDFIDDYLSEPENRNENLAEILNKAKAIINNLDGSNPSALAQDIKTTSAELTQYLHSEESNLLSDNDSNRLEELSMALKIADKLEPENLSSNKVNQYMKVLGQSF